MCCDLPDACVLHGNPVTEMHFYANSQNKNEQNRTGTFISRNKSTCDYHFLLDVQSYTDQELVHLLIEMKIFLWNDQELVHLLIERVNRETPKA